jgi:hypothetical protein
MAVAISRHVCIVLFQAQHINAIGADRWFDQIPVGTPDVEHLNDLVHLVPAQVAVGT